MTYPATLVLISQDHDQADLTSNDATRSDERVDKGDGQLWVVSAATLQLRLAHIM